MMRRETLAGRGGRFSPRSTKIAFLRAILMGLHSFDRQDSIQVDDARDDCRKQRKKL